MQKLICDALAIMLIGDSVLSMVEPKRHVQSWNRGPKVWRDAMEALSERPGLMRAAGALGLALGLWLATHE